MRINVIDKDKVSHVNEVTLINIKKIISFRGL